MKRVVPIFCFLLAVSPLVYGQSSASRESDIKKYIDHVNALAGWHDASVKVTKSAGPVESDRTVTELNNTSKRIHSTIGSFTKTMVSTADGRQLLKLEYSDSTDQLFYECYYYQNNQLVAASEWLKNAETHIILYSREQYFDKGVDFATTSSSSDVSLLTPKNRGRVAAALPDNAARYLREFFK